MDGALTRRLTAVIGGPGTGKTTLLTQWAGEHRVVWHTANPGESAAALARALVDGLGDYVSVTASDLAMTTDAALRAPDDNPAQAEALAAAICQQLTAALMLSDDVTVVIDDAQHLGREDGATALIAALVRHAPERLHVIVASRRALPFPTARLLLDGEAAELLGAELSFNADEAAELLGADAAGAEVEALLARTGGWAVAVALAARAVPPPGSGRSAAPPDRQLFAYLADELLAVEPADSLAAIGVAAALPWLTDELAVHLGLGEAGLALADAQRASITMTPVAVRPGAVAVTPLIAELFSSPRAPVIWADGTVDAARLGAAVWYEAQHEHGAALACLLQAGETGQLAAFLARNSSVMVAAGHAAEVLDAVQLVERSGAAVGVELTIVWIDSLLALGRADEVVERFQPLTTDVATIDPSIAWRLGSLHYLRSDTDSAGAVLARADLEGGRLGDEAACLAWSSAVRWARGDRHGAFEHAHLARQRAATAGDDRASATAYTMLTMIARVDGDHVAQHRNYRLSLEHAERAKDLLQVVRIRCNHGSHLTEDGDYTAALAELDVATRLADLGGFGMFRGLCLTNRAEALVALGRLDEAVSDLDAARAIFHQVAPPMDAFAVGLLGEVYLARGDLSLAVAAFEEAVALAVAGGEVQSVVPALTGLATARLDDDPKAALEAAERAVSIEATVHHARALVALGRVRTELGDLPDALELAERAATLARERGDRPALALAIELQASLAHAERRTALLTDARSMWSELGSPLGIARLDVALAELTPGADGAALAASAADALDRIGAKREAARARAVAAAYTDVVAGVHVTVLGGFAVAVGGDSVPASRWQSKIARDLFKMLAINRGRPIHREVLIERLWPGEFGEKASNRLSVALSAIRSATDSMRSQPGDFVVVADRESVALNVANVTVDVDLFLAEGGRGLALLRQARRHQGLALLRLAERRYAGDVLEEQPYADWALPVREEASALYLSVAAALAGADAGAGDHESAARRFLRMVERDPYSELAYLGAVSALRAAGHHGSAQRLYGTYAAKMAEIDIEPKTFPVVGETRTQLPAP